MITKRKLGVLGVLLLSFLLSAAQEGTMVVKLTVKHDGQEKPAPDQVTLSFDDHSLQILVREGKFEVPPEVTNAREVTFVADIEGDRIRIAGISGRKFVHEDWTLVLADRDYGEDYQWILQKAKHADIRSSCILEFEPTDEGDGTFVFVIKPDDSVTVRPVTLTQQDDVQSVLASGLQAGQRVVTTGFAQLAEGKPGSVSDGNTAPPAADPLCWFCWCGRYS